MQLMSRLIRPFRLKFDRDSFQISVLQYRELDWIPHEHHHLLCEAVAQTQMSLFYWTHLKPHPSMALAKTTFPWSGEK